MTIIAQAPAPSRSAATAVINWGLINIEVSLFTATESTRIARSEYTYAEQDGSEPVLCKVGRQQYNQLLGGEVVSADIVKMATATDGTKVELTDDEIASATMKGDGTAPIVAVIPAADIVEKYRVEKYYQVRAKSEKKGGAAHEKAFNLLMAALTQRGEAALIRLSIRKGAAQYAALTGDGSLAVLHFTDGVRAERPMPKTDLQPAELEMASTLLDAIGSSVPDMRDENAALIQAFVDAKAGGVETPQPAEVTPVAGAESLTDLLAASIQAVA